MRRRRHGRCASRVWCRSSAYSSLVRTRRILRPCSARTRLTVQPAQPAPESLPPRKPGAFSAASIRASSARRAVFEVVAAGRVRRRHQPAERSDIATLQGLDALAHPLILAQDVPGPLSADRVEVAPSRPRAARASARRAGTHLGGESGPGRPPRRVRTRPAFWSYMPSASRREVLESHTTIAGAGGPAAGEHAAACRNRGRGHGRRGRRGSRTGRASPIRPRRTRSPTAATSWRVPSGGDRPDHRRSPGSKCPGPRRLDQELGDGRLQASRARQPGPSGTSPATTASKPDASGPHHAVNAQQTPRTYRVQAPGSLRSIASSEYVVGLAEIDRATLAWRPPTRRPTTTAQRSIAAAMTRPPL